MYRYGVSQRNTERREKSIQVKRKKLYVSIRKIEGGLNIAEADPYKRYTDYKIKNRDQDMGDPNGHLHCVMQEGERARCKSKMGLRFVVLTRNSR